MADSTKIVPQASFWLECNKSNEKLLQILQAVLQESRIPNDRCLSENNVVLKCQWEQARHMFYAL